LPFEVFNPWGTTASGYTPYDSNIYGLFIANAPFISQNFTYESFGVGAAAGGNHVSQGTNVQQNGLVFILDGGNPHHNDNTPSQGALWTAAGIPDLEADLLGHTGPANAPGTF
jgi:hypothetical protein